MKRLLMGLAAVVLLFGAQGALAAEIVLSLHADRVVNRIDEKVYGHFLEHIYHSVNGGLWGEMIWNRSFEETPEGYGDWAVRGDCLQQRGMGTGVRLLVGDPAWRDYEYTVEARKTGGREGFLIFFRAADDENNFYWYNLGGWGNVRHGLERTARGQKRGAARPVAGAIEQGKWYTIRVRCQGPRVQLWLDGQQLLDFEDPTPHLAGRVGVGTWATQAEFRDLEVTSLDGKLLHAGLPQVPSLSGAGPYWQPYGPGACSLSSEKPLNGDLSLGIESAGPETGVQQTPLCLRAGERYQGSIWARKEGNVDLVVRLLDGQKVLDEMTLLARPDASKWVEYPIQFTAKSTAENATVQIGMRGKGRVWLDQVSLMPDSSRATGGFRPDLLQAVADLRPPVIRWPGGCFASAYRWKSGIGAQHQRVKYPRAIWDDVDVNSFGTDEFVAMCGKAGAEPLIVINIGTKNWNGDVDRQEFIDDACDWVEYCNGPATSRWGKVRAANGHAEPCGVKYWEIDNETWHLAPQDYAEAVCQFVGAMKKIDPSIKVAACGSGGLSATGRGLEWNRIVLEGCARHIDYLSTHHYENPNNYATGPAAHEAFLRETAKLIAASANPRVRIYCSEWNAQSTDWRTGLYAAGLLNAFERCGDFFEIGGPALFLRHVSAIRWDNAFINFDHRTWFPAPNYVVMKLWRDHYAPERIALSGEMGSLNAVGTRSQDGRTLCFKAVNPADQPTAVALKVEGGFTVGRASMQLVAADSLEARNTLDAPQAIRPVAEKVETTGGALRLTMPRWSTAVVTIERE